MCSFGAYISMLYVFWGFFVVFWWAFLFWFFLFGGFFGPAAGNALQLAVISLLLFIYCHLAFPTVCHLYNLLSYCILKVCFFLLVY